MSKELYHFDRYLGERLMAEGAIVYAESDKEAEALARALFERGARPGEIARTEFVRRRVSPLD